MNITPPIENPTSKWYWPKRKDGPSQSFDGKECLIMDHLLDRIKKCIEDRTDGALREAIADHLAFSQACHLRIKIEASSVENLDARNKKA